MRWRFNHIEIDAFRKTAMKTLCFASHESFDRKLDVTTGTNNKEDGRKW